jgi:Mg2+ and Co2+ transporter CorA
MKKFILLSFVGVFTFACVDFNRDYLLQKVSKIDQQLLEIEGKLKDERLNDVSTIKLNIMQTELRIKQNLHLDTIDIALAKKLDAYKGMRRSIKPMLQQYLKVREGINEEKRVLKQLRKDIKEGRGERNRYPEYIRFERQKVRQLSSLTTEYLRTKELFFKDYARLYPPIEAFSRALLQKKQNR